MYSPDDIVLGCPITAEVFRNVLAPSAWPRPPVVRAPGAAVQLAPPANTGPTSRARAPRVPALCSRLRTSSRPLLSVLEVRLGGGWRVRFSFASHICIFLAAAADWPRLPPPLTSIVYLLIQTERSAEQCARVPDSSEGVYRAYCTDGRLTGGAQDRLLHPSEKETDPKTVEPVCQHCTSDPIRSLIPDPTALSNAPWPL
ncbi:hypothetical protein NDU88_002026 [Pleurodeles waltl]|uniref:Uncharacterized protein n=1 Tax=Pleurodeles waltl TaxID=8319 RepID=A0AAV7MLG5_PLEWA|nr:hypothetical protein NDU88_002026 [Pleurodeles waltl]